MADYPKIGSAAPKFDLPTSTGKSIKLDDFMRRLWTLDHNAPGGEAKISIRGFSEFSPLAYAIDQTRRAGIKHVVVESGATPDPKFGFSWFDWR